MLGNTQAQIYAGLCDRICKTGYIWLSLSYLSSGCSTFHFSLAKSQMSWFVRVMGLLSLESKKKQISPSYLNSIFLCHSSVFVLLFFIFFAEAGCTPINHTFQHVRYVTVIPRQIYTYCSDSVSLSSSWLLWLSEKHIYKNSQACPCGAKWRDK